jgi:hypothetical protein
VRCGQSVRFEGDWGGTGGSGANNGPSAPGRRTVRAPRGLSAGASRTFRARHVQVGWSREYISQAVSFLLLKPNPSLFYFSVSCSLSLKKRPSPWGFCLGHSPDRPSTSPDSPRGSPPCQPGIFSHISLSLSNFEQEGD